MLERRARTRARELLCATWGSTDRLLGGKRMLHYRLQESQFFLEAMQESFAAQYLTNPALARLCREEEFYPHQLRLPHDAWRIPRQASTGLEAQPRTARRLGRSLQRMLEDLRRTADRHTHYFWVGAGFPDWLLRAVEGSTRVASSRSFGRPGRELAAELESAQGPVRLVVAGLELLDRVPLHLTSTSPNNQLFVFEPGLTGAWPAGDVVTRLGLLSRNVQRFGHLAGHPLPLPACERGYFHLCRLNRVVERPDGTKGLLSPVSRSDLPLHSAIDPDTVWQTGCPCGRSSPWTVGRRGSREDLEAQAGVVIADG